MHGKVCKHACRHHDKADECPQDNRPKLLHLLTLPSNNGKHHDASDVEEQEIELHPEEKRDTDAHHERLEAAWHLCSP